MQQVKDSPGIDTVLATILGRRFLVVGYGYAGGTVAVLPVPESRLFEEDITAAQGSNDDLHPDSVGAITGCHIHASDGEIGRVEDFLVEDADWSIRYLVLATVGARGRLDG